MRGRSKCGPGDHEAYHCLAPLLAHNGDEQAYRRLCGQMLKQFAGSSDPAIAERTAKDCLILPAAGTDFDGISRMVDIALAAGVNHPFWNYFQFVKGLLEYRQGHFANAAEWVQKVVGDERDPNRTVAAYMVLAMAQRQLRQTDDARATLAKGLKFANANVASIQGPQWNDQMVAHQLMSEARGLIENGAEAGGETK